MTPLMTKSRPCLKCLASIHEMVLALVKQPSVRLDSPRLGKAIRISMGTEKLDLVIKAMQTLFDYCVAINMVLENDLLKIRPLTFFSSHTSEGKTLLKKLGDVYEKTTNGLIVSADNLEPKAESACAVRC